MQYSRFIFRFDARDMRRGTSILAFSPALGFRSGFVSRFRFIGPSLHPHWITPQMGSVSISLDPSTDNHPFSHNYYYIIPFLSGYYSPCSDIIEISVNGLVWFVSTQRQNQRAKQLYYLGCCLNGSCWCVREIGKQQHSTLMGHFFPLGHLIIPK